MIDMRHQNKITESPNNTDQGTPLSTKIQELNKSVTEVQKYELLTTNQYLQQMEILLQILDNLSFVLESKCIATPTDRKNSIFKH